MSLSTETQAAIDKALESKAAADEADKQTATDADAEAHAKAALDKATADANDARHAAMVDAQAAVTALGAELGLSKP